MTIPEVVSRDEAATLSPRELREVIASGRWTTPTWSLALGYLQANLVILPEKDAFEFLTFCTRNSKPCPIVEVGEPGSPTVGPVAPGADLRTDIPKYRVFRDGEQEDEPTDITSYWRDDLVGFLLGCSLTFEEALLDAGVPLRHLEAGTIAPMYETDRACRPAGKFSGNMVVSMRMIPADLVPRAVQVTSRYPLAHGAPVHVGSPDELGIRDLGEVDFGDQPVAEPGDVPVFWGCGVTPQIVARSARPEIMIAHYPGCMFITDRRSEIDAAL